MNFQSSVPFEEQLLLNLQNRTIVLTLLNQLMMESNLSMEIFDNVSNKVFGDLFSETVPFSPVAWNQFWTYRLQHSLKIYIPPFLLTFGIIGNILSFVIFRHKSMKNVPINTFLAVLAVADTCVLVFGLLSTWLHEIYGVDVFRSVDFSCKICNVLAYTFSLFSVWLIVLITAKRFIAVCLPLLAYKLKISNDKVLKIVLVLFVFSLIINSHFLVTTGITVQYTDGRNSVKCDAVLAHRDLLTKIWPWVDAAFFSVVPICLILILNTSIIINIFIARQKVRRLQTRGQKRDRSGRDLKLTILLLAISFTFCISSSPMAVLMVSGELFNESITSSTLSTLWLIRTVCELLMYLNHSINFMFYCKNSPRFRRILMKIRKSKAPEHYPSYTSPNCLALQTI